MRKFLIALLLALSTVASASAQISVPNTFATGGRILASEVNANFDALESAALNRTGGALTGNITASAGVTVDGIDIGSVLGGTGTPTFSTLTVTNSGTFGTTLGVTGATTLSSTLAVTGNVAVNTNKFNITAASGNTTVAGTLDVTGAGTFSGALSSGTTMTVGTTLNALGAVLMFSTADVAGNFAVNSNKFTVAAATGNTLVAGTLNVTGASTFTAAVAFLDALSTNGTATLGALQVINAANFDAGVTMDTTLGVTGNTTVGGTFGVTGATTLSSTLGVAGTADFAGAIVAGSGNVGIIDGTGKIPAISSTYFASLVGTNLTGVGLLASTNTWTGRNDLKGYTELKSTSNPSGSAITYDLSNGTHFETALTGNATVTISNVPAPTNGVVAFTVKFTADGTLRTFTWPGSVVWPGGVAPVFTSTNNKRDIITFISYDAGTTWFGFVGGQNF